MRALAIGVVLSIASAAAALAGPGEYIVLLKPDAQVGGERVARVHGAAPRLVFSHAARGFAGPLSPERVASLRRDARVLAVVPDIEVRIARHNSRHNQPPTPTPQPTPTAQIIPTGIKRVNADDQTVVRIDGTLDTPEVDIAIIDTGVQRDHPDLRVAGDVSFVPGVATGEDDHGHGTFVAGVAAARDNAGGVVGVCPGARVWALKVLDAQGLGDLSAVVAALDWVLDESKHPGTRFDVVNLSITADVPLGSGSDPLLPAVQRVHAAGITMIAAAGNEGVDAKDTVPARYDEVICVSALADYDGRPGSLGGFTSNGVDDRFASFSNYGTVVDMIAPGVNITSTHLGSRVATGSGTSFAAPHVSGAVALYRLAHPLATPAEVRAGLLASGVTPTAQSGWSSVDRDGIAEPLLNVGAFVPAPAGIYVAISLDRPFYIGGQDAGATLTAEVVDERAAGVAGLGATDFILDIDGAASPVTLTADPAPGLYRASIPLAAFLEGLHPVALTAVDRRAFSATATATLTFYASATTAPGGTAGGAGAGGGEGGGGGGGCTAGAPAPAAWLPLLAMALALAYPAARASRPARILSLLACRLAARYHWRAPR